jgi:mycothiol synthase
MGNTPAARALAATHGLLPARELLIMTRPLLEPVPEPPLPPGTTLRTFVVGQDEEEWLGVNARAFRGHPEQGRLSRSDLEERMAEPWFDPAGFFLAVRTDAEGAERVVGFHWTKQHPDGLGEVYVLGVDPSAGGGGLGKSLLARGLQHLRERGNTSVQLYVEADHGRAVALYAGYGFTVASRDVMYAQRDTSQP